MSDPVTRDERAADARALQANPILRGVLAEMERDAIATIKGVPWGDLTGGAAHGTLVAIETFKARLEAIITDAKMNRQRNNERS